MKVVLFFFVVVFPIAVAGQSSTNDPWEDDWGEDWGEESSGLVWSGFVEGALGARLQSDPVVGSRSTLGDLRLRVETDRAGERIAFGFKADGLYDDIESKWSGKLRELTFSLPVGDFADVKVGRQILTWGTGDLVFLNDLFPKDFVSFFAGREDEYLKAPSDTIRVTGYNQLVNWDFAWTPDFEPDEFLTGERFSFFSPASGTVVAPQPPLRAIEPASKLSNSELALRLFKTIGGREYALYFYRGFFKQPRAVDQSGRATFAPLTALGGSLRRPLGPGLFNTEFSYYASRDDRAGSNPRVPNDQVRLLAGYEWEALTNFTVGFQYYLEWTLDYDELLRTSQVPRFEPEEHRHVLTNRLSYRALQDKLNLSLFTFYSPTDQDAYWRPQVNYRYSDQWSFTAGGNIFAGADVHTFFGQLEKNSNGYVRIRFNY